VTGLSRRGLIAGGLCACCLPGAAGAQRISPSAMTPLIGKGYRPVDTDEKGLWSRVERIEEEIAGSSLRVTDPALTAYLSGVQHRVAREAEGSVRLYVMRSADFNAAMFPNGMMLIHTGTLVRFRNEAQLAGVLAHETAHYLRKHQVRSWRDLKLRSDIMSFASVGLGLAGAATGIGGGDLIYSLNNAIYLGAFAYSRSLESEADAMSLSLMRHGGYRPAEAPDIWKQLIAERRASAAARGKRRRRGYSVLSTHPADDVRMADLIASTEEMADGRDGATGEADYRVAIAAVRPMLIDDLVKLNDPGSSLHVIDRLAESGWDGLLRYHQAEAYRLRGEPGDVDRMQASLDQAVAYADAPAEAYRAQGYALLKKGDGAGGKAMLGRYLAARPDAKDAGMIKFTLAQ
jgi:Zn-dependent protease with chaperone function